MKIGVIDIPSLSYEGIFNVQEKSGSRFEFSLPLSDDIIKIGQQMTSMPLRFASIVLAEPGDTDQLFHKDRDTGERALVYLTDVMSESNGPIEFLQEGKILGRAGTFVHYEACESHRGCKSDIHRLALALAFDHLNERITTIGAAPPTCESYVCPTGYRLKDPLPPNPASASTAECCDIIPEVAEKNDIWLIVGLLGLIVAAIVGFKFLAMVTAPKSS